VFLRDEAPLHSIAERLRAKGEGEISLVVMLGPDEGEIEVKLPGRYAVTGALAGALKAVAGVVQVEHV
jgi:DNA polymerase-3 subunit alpha